MPQWFHGRAGHTQQGLQPACPAWPGASPGAAGRSRTLWRRSSSIAWSPSGQTRPRAGEKSTGPMRRIWRRGRRVRDVDTGGYMAAVATRQPRDILVTDVIYREDLYPRSLTNPERVQEYAENLDAWDSENEIAFFCRPLGHIVFVIREGTYFWRDALGKAILDAWRATLAEIPLEPKAFPSESALVAAICIVLTDNGWVCRREVKTKLCRIDVLAQKGEDIQVIEAKLSFDSNSMSHALGQVLFAKEAFPTASLFIATPLRPPSHLIRCLNQYAVSYLEGPWIVE